VSLTSDWGMRDPSPAICRGVVLNIAPDALIVDVTHEVEKYNIRHGALMLWCALPFLPVGAHVCVIDPGVGTARRPIAIETGRGDFLVGPDNGVLIPGAERIGGINRVHAIDNVPYRLPVVSATFHGRDLFTPTAAHLALGVQLDEIGPPIDPSELVKLEWPQAVVHSGTLETKVIYRDTFGNVKLAGLTSDLEAAAPALTRGAKVNVTFGSGNGNNAATSTVMTWAQTFGDVEVGDYIVYEDSYGRLCIAQSQGDAVKTLGIEEDSTVRIEPA
jgi:S-adenosylmethionine hydrolase